MTAEREEQARIVALKSYGLLDTPNEAVFDRIVLDTKRKLGMPIVLISLVDSDRQWFKAKIGLDALETPRCISFCTHALHGRDVFVVPDATLDPRFADNPLVTHDPHIRFYAGAPLVTGRDRRIGTLCVIDTRPRPDFGTAAAAELASLAAQTMAAFEVRSLQRREHAVAG